MICNCIVQNDFDFARISAKGNVKVGKREDAWNEVRVVLPARFGLKWPSRVVEALRENLVQLNPEEGRKRDEM